MEMFVIFIGLHNHDLGFKTLMRHDLHLREQSRLAKKERRIMKIKIRE
jgi:hypothetical protein